MRAALVLALACGCHGASVHDQPDGNLGGSGGTGGEGDGADAALAGSGDAPSGGAVAFACPSGAPKLVAGQNTLTVGSARRTFALDLPASTTGPLGVVFSWHGFGDTGANFRTQLALDPNADPALPVIIVTPDDTGLLPPAGLAWDIMGTGSANADLALFEAVTGCLQQQYPVDGNAIFSFGFSAGAVMTNLVHASHPETVRAIVTESGAWFDDPDEVKLVTVPLPWAWPALDANGSGDVLETHGGANDVAAFNVISLEAAAQKELPFLLAHKRTVVDCAHDLGHAIDPDVSSAVIVQWLTAHRTGAAAPALPPACSVH